MSILVNVQNKREESVLMAFLESNAISYKITHEDKDLESQEQFLENYNQELVKADLEIEAGNFLSQNEVELLLNRGKRKS